MTMNEQLPQAPSKIVQEIAFAVPWGVIAAKAWGDPCNKPVLFLHGIQDNAGSFDRLISLLPSVFYYVCIDLPGHGLSSRLPKGFRLDIMDYVLSVNRVVVKLKWKQFYLIGHSLGGQLSHYYAATYPEQIEKLVIIDAYGPIPISSKDYLIHLKSAQEKILKLEEKMEKSDPPSYTYEQALEKSITNRRSAITKEAAEKLLPRNLKHGKNGYYFSTDQRLKLHVTLPLSFKQMCQFLANVRCPSLHILTESLYNLLGLDDEVRVQSTFYRVFMENPFLKIVKVKGNHDVHNVSPEIVAPYIIDFLLGHRSSL